MIRVIKNHWKTISASNRIYILIFVCCIIVVLSLKLIPNILNLYIDDILVFNLEDDKHSIKIINPSFSSTSIASASSILLTSNIYQFELARDILVQRTSLQPLTVNIRASIMTGELVCKIQLQELREIESVAGTCNLKRINIGEDPNAYSLGIQGIINADIDIASQKNISIHLTADQVQVDPKKIVGSTLNFPSVEEGFLEIAATLQNQSFNFNNTTFKSEFGTTEFTGLIDSIKNNNSPVSGTASISLNAEGQEKILPWLKLLNQGKKVEENSELILSGTLKAPRMTFK